MWGYGPGMMGYGGWHTGPGMLFGGLIWILFVVLAVALAARFFRGSWHDGGRAEPRASGLDVLNERYARGEIGRDEYLQKKRDITERAGG
jgi:putative membrane protein